MQTNKTLKLYNIKTTRVGVSIVNEDNWIKDIDVDLQPYNTALLLKNYGYNIEVTNRIFYEDTDISIGNRLKDIDPEGNVKHIYQVQKIITWDTYQEIFTLEVAK